MINTNSSFINWTLNGAAVSANPNYTTPAITSNAIYTANFSLNVPPTPTNLQASNIGANYWTLTWNNVPVAVNYKIYDNEILLSASKTSSFTLTNAQPSTPYKLTVTALDSYNTESNQSNPLTITTLAGVVTTQKYQVVLVSPDNQYYWDSVSKEQKHLGTALVTEQTSLDQAADKAIIVKPTK